MKFALFLIAFNTIFNFSLSNNEPCFGKRKKLLKVINDTAMIDTMLNQMILDTKDKKYLICKNKTLFANIGKTIVFTGHVLDIKPTERFLAIPFKLKKYQFLKMNHYAVNVIDNSSEFTEQYLPNYKIISHRVNNKKVTVIMQSQYDLDFSKINVYYKNSITKSYPAQRIAMIHIDKKSDMIFKKNQIFEIEFDLSSFNNEMWKFYKGNSSFYYIQIGELLKR